LKSCVSFLNLGSTTADTNATTDDKDLLEDLLGDLLGEEKIIETLLKGVEYNNTTFLVFKTEEVFFLIISPTDKNPMEDPIIYIDMEEYDDGNQNNSLYPAPIKLKVGKQNIEIRSFPGTSGGKYILKLISGEEYLKTQYTPIFITDRNVTLDNGIETILSKGRLNIKEDIVINNIYLSPSKFNSNLKLDEILADVTLNIGGNTFRCDIQENDIKCENINFSLFEGEVDVLVTGTLKYNDEVSNDSVLSINLDIIEAEDMDGEDIIIQYNDGADAPKTILEVN